MAAVTSFHDLLERYRRGERDFTGSDLDADPDNDLSGVCLDCIDLSRSFVVADFRRASLRGARFREANVKTCDFAGAQWKRLVEREPKEVERLMKQFVAQGNTK